MLYEVITLGARIPWEGWRLRMFDQLSDRLQSAFKSLTGRGRLSESNIEEAMREVRRALLEADVNFKVARKFVDDVRVRAVGEDVLNSLTPGQQVVKIVHDELVKLLGDTGEPFRIPTRITSYNVCYTKLLRSSSSSSTRTA